MRAIVILKSRLCLRIVVGCFVVTGPLMPLSNSLGRETGDVRPKPIVLVPPFENQSKHHENISIEVAGNKEHQLKRRYIIDRYTEAPRSLFEDMIVNLEGVTIVERQRIDTLLVESEFGRLSGLVDQEKALKLGKMLGANLIVMGTIIDIREEMNTFEGYGVRNEGMSVLCTIRIRLLDSKGEVQFSKLFKGTRSYSKSSFGGKQSSDRDFAAIEAAIEKIGEDPQFQAAIIGRKIEAKTTAPTDGLIEVDFSPKPENSDIEIDGKYIGGSPLKRRLPAGKEYKVRISKGGFKDWEGVIVPETGLRITRELSPSL